MNSHLKNILILILLSLNLPLVAQVSILFPYNRSVFQRNNQNQSFIPISGTCSKATTKIEARLQVINGGIATGWSTIDGSPQNGHYSGEISGTGGWYKLEIRSTDLEGNLEYSALEKVGIGEVFVVSGQSNAEGFKRFNPKGAFDDRVNSLNFSDKVNMSTEPTYTDFSHLSADTEIAPIADSPWCWGELGSYIAQRENVPVLFFNAAWEGTSLDFWIRSSNNEIVRNEYYNFNYVQGFPFNFLKITLKTYCSRFGIRSVLWQQGEAEVNNSADYVYTNLNQLISKTREETGKDLTWTVSRTSLGRTTSTYPEVIEGQNRVIQNDANVFAGPITDTIQVPRTEGTHFVNYGNGNDGISDLAIGWNNALNSTFFANSTPFLPTSQFDLQIIACNSSNEIGLKIPDNYSEYKWSNNNSDRTLRNTTGIYSAISYDTYGNSIYSPNYNIDLIKPTSTPSITLDQTASTLCEGDSIRISLNNNAIYPTYLWSTAETTSSIIVTTNANYSVTGIDANQCKSSVSNIVNPNFNERPDKPSIISENSAVECQGQSIKLQAQGNGNNYLWSNGEKTSEINISKIGLNKFTVNQTSFNGCTSEESDVFETLIIQTPETPEVSKTSPVTIATTNLIDSDLGLEWFKDGQSYNEFTKTIVPIETGVYNVATFKIDTLNNQTKKCYSSFSGSISFNISNENKFYVFPIPTLNKTTTIGKAIQEENLILELIDLNGITIKKEAVQLKHGTVNFRFSGVSTGHYILKISGETSTDIRRILID